MNRPRDVEGSGTLATAGCPGLALDLLGARVDQRVVFQSIIMSISVRRVRKTHYQSTSWEHDDVPFTAPHSKPARQQRLAGFFMGECRHVPRPVTRGVTIWCGTHTLCPGHRCGSPLRWTQPDLVNEVHFGGHGLESQDGCQYPQGRTSVCWLSKALFSPVSGSANSSDLASNCRGRE